jgi:hypothetical protein
MAGSTMPDCAVILNNCWCVSGIVAVVVVAEKVVDVCVAEQHSYENLASLTLPRNACLYIC